jgi:MFS transporter, NNP family, nitrate/nitrite transporter
LCHLLSIAVAPPCRKKYPVYYINVDPNQDDKATELRMLSFKRPHMRSFHAAWFGFFMAFFIWFAIAPLLPEIKHSLHLSKDEIWMSSICGVMATISARFLLGPMCDKYGPRILFSALLILSSIPTACTGLVQTSVGLSVLRLCIGLAGGIFVTCLYWTTRMFTKEVVGTANGLVGESNIYRMHRSARLTYFPASSHWPIFLLQVVGVTSEVVLRIWSLERSSSLS